MRQSRHLAKLVRGPARQAANPPAGLGPRYARFVERRPAWGASCLVTAGNG